LFCLNAICEHERKTKGKSNSLILSSVIFAKYTDLLQRQHEPESREVAMDGTDRYWQQRPNWPTLVIMC